MRKELCEALIGRAKNPEMTFLTGDLGFMALEPLQEVLGNRFINAGIAEQNMISVAAGLAKQDLEVWVYSIAPFLYARPFEQIRNDVAFHNLPVKLIGNGGGYGYGVMGPTHHAIEDYGVLLTLPNMSVYVPVFDEDMFAVIDKATHSTGPLYIRMGKGIYPKGYAPPAYEPWRQLTEGLGPVMIVVGPLAGTYIETFNNMPQEVRPNLWALSELPVKSNPPPDNLLNQIRMSMRLCVAEEHVQNGGVASQLLLYFAENKIQFPEVKHLYARAHHFDTYGSQSFLRKQSGLDVNNVLLNLKEW